MDTVGQEHYLESITRWKIQIISLKNMKKTAYPPYANYNVLVNVNNVDHQDEKSYLGNRRIINHEQIHSLESKYEHSTFK